MGLFDKVKDRLGPSSTSTSTSPQAAFAAPSPALPLDQALPRYRRQIGINLGAWFVCEDWIVSSPFRNVTSKGRSDWDIAGAKDAKRVLEEHWDAWIGESDWAWIKANGYNSVRLPIGYHHLCGAIPDVLKGTDFEKFQSVYEGAWGRIEKAIQVAAAHGLGVMVDLHAAAGAQNNDAHAGVPFGRADLFNKKANLASTVLALRFLAFKLHPNPNVIGLELLNEPARDGRLFDWYRSTLPSLREVCPADFPLYIHDMWETGTFSKFVGERKDFVVLDHHLYRCYPPDDIKYNGVQHAAKLRDVNNRNEWVWHFGQWSGETKGSIVVAEWSASLFWDLIKDMPDGEKDRQRREFVKAELELFERSTAGSWFWTLKKGNNNWDAGWNAMDATRAEVLPKSFGVKVKSMPDDGKKQQASKAGGSAHRSYWSSHGGSPHPESYAPGFSQGWDDAKIFLGKGMELGFVSRWCARRMAERGVSDGDWEWEHGFQQGVEGCKKAATS